MLVRLAVSGSMEALVGLSAGRGGNRKQEGEVGKSFRFLFHFFLLGLAFAGEW